MPVGESARIAAEKALSQLGFETADRYIEKVWINDSKLPFGGAWRMQR